MIGSQKQEKISSVLFPGNYNGSLQNLFSIHISGIPLQGICTVGPGVQEERHLRSVNKYISSKGIATFEETF
jgi:hypothetical protein